MKDIENPKLLYFKGFLMLLTGVLASGILVAIHPTWETFLLLPLAVWGFARAYYFAFYVIEHYIDPGYRYAGLIDFLRHWGKGPTAKSSKKMPPNDHNPTP